MAAENNGKYIFGTVRVGEKGQIVIPKQCREVFGIKPGDSLLVLGDVNQGIGIVKQETMLEFARAIFAAPEERAEPTEPEKRKETQT